MEISIGTSAFYNRHWKGIFYPEKLAQKNWFSFYCAHFDTFEINGSFYRFPTPKTMQDWYSKSPVEFVYSVKAPQLITHYKRLKECKTEISDFVHVCQDGLREKLGWLLFQMPPSFDFSEERLELVLENLDLDSPTVIEFRHVSWFRNEVKQELGKRNIVMCSPSYPKLPETILICNGIAYIRLHGHPQLFYSAYSDDELNTILDETAGAQKVFLYFNNTASTAGIENALSLKRILANRVSLEKQSR